MDRRFRFGHQHEDADDGSDFLLPTPDHSKRKYWTCWWCSHLNPERAVECEQCGLERDDAE